MTGLEGLCYYGRPTGAGLLTYVYVLLIASVSWLFYIFTRAADRALTEATDNFIHNAGSGVAHGFGTRLVSSLFKYMLLGNDAEATVREAASEIVPGVMLLW